MKTLAIFLLSLLTFSLSAYCIEPPETEYYALMMDAKKIGFVEDRRIVKDKVVTTTSKTKMTIGRMGSFVTVITEQTSVETITGKPISFESAMNMSGMSLKTSGKFLKNGKVEITTNQSGTVKKKIIDCPKEALMAEGLRLLQIKKRLSGGTSYTAKQFSPVVQQAVDLEVKIGPKVDVNLFGRVVSLTEVKETVTMGSGKIFAVNYIDKKSFVQKSIVAVSGMKTTMIACDKEFALSPDEQVDFLDKLLLDSPKELKLDGKIVKGKLTYTIKPTDGAKITIPSGDNQKVETKKDGTLIVTVDPVKAKEGVKFPYKGKNPKILKMLEPTMYLQSDDKKVIELAKAATKGTNDTAKAAKAIEKFVGDYISEKNLSVGYATAAEVAQSKQGDCSEHAVLTAAMCRAIGIPARVVVGIVYVEEFGNRTNIFGGHAWNQVYIGGKWIGIDATRGFGAGHIELATGTGEPSDFFSMVNTLGYFKIVEIK